MEVAGVIGASSLGPIKVYMFLSNWVLRVLMCHQAMFTTDPDKIPLLGHPEGTR